MVLIEGMAMSFWLLLVCVVGIADSGPIGLVCLYEKEVQERVVKLGLTTKEKIRDSMTITSIALFVPVLVNVPAMVYYINKADSFLSAFWQMSAIMLIMGIFDRLFIDIYWVDHTKAWIIKGTEDLMPYVPIKTHIKKWIGTLVGFPLIAAAIAGLVELCRPSLML